MIKLEEKNLSNLRNGIKKKLKSRNKRRFLVNYCLVDTSIDVWRNVPLCHFCRLGGTDTPSRNMLFCRRHCNRALDLLPDKLCLDLS